MSDLEHINELNALRDRALERTIRAQEAEAALASAQAENERLRRIQSIADCGTAENFLKCDDETKRLVFALMCEESSRRKEAEQEVERLRADLTAYAKTAALIDQADRRVVEVLTWLDERGRNSQSYGSHADAYEIAARKLRAALSNTEEAGG